MLIEPQIVVQSSAVRNTWVTAQPPAAAARLPWTGFKLTNEKTFFDQLLSIINSYNGPICQTTTNISNLDYGGWFNYFYNEAKGSINREKNTAVRQGFEQNFGRIFCLLFDLKVTGAGTNAKIDFLHPFPAPLSPAFLTLMANAPGVLPKGILSYVFELGFEEATTTTAGDYFGKTLALKSNMTDGVAIRSSKGEFVFAYRGDTRDLGSIIKQGANCRAELDFWRDDAHIDEAWHPWSDVDDKWKKMWFRKGSADNDYFTMNSLAKEFHISCAYPMFRSFEIHQGLVGPASGWTPIQRARLTPKNMKVVTVYDKKSNSWQEVPCDDSRAFACAISSGTTAAKTYELNDYPESAVRNVNLADMIAWIKIRRYHRPPASAHEPYDSTRSDPSMTIKVMSWGWVRSEDETRASLGCTVSGIKVVAAKLQNLVGKIFDISHTKYYPDASYDVNRIQPQVPVGPAPKIEPKTVKLSNR